jgi:hypothetical protein
MDNKAVLKKQIEDIALGAEYQRLSIARHTTSDTQRWDLLNLKLKSLRERLTKMGGAAGTPSQRVLARAGRSASGRRDAATAGLEKKSNAFKPEPGVGLGRTGIKQTRVAAPKKSKTETPVTSATTPTLVASNDDNVLDD